VSQVDLHFSKKEGLLMFRTMFLLIFLSPFFAVQAHDDGQKMVDNYIAQAQKVIQAIDNEQPLAEVKSQTETLLQIALPILEYGAAIFPECAELALATKVGLSENLENLTYDQIDNLYHQEPEDDAKDRCYYHRDLPIHAAFVLAFIKEQGDAARTDMKTEMTEIIPNAEKLKTYLPGHTH
jgi:hypothetical protein